MSAPAPRALAAIDLGTNSFRMAIAEVDPSSGHFRVLLRVREQVRIGQGTRDRRLTAGSMARGVAVLKRFRKEADRWKAEVRAVATSAVREALNRDAFLRLARREAGVAVQVVSGAEEARLIYLGALQGLPARGRPVLLVDIGGGSTEFLVARGRAIRYAHSLKLGAIRMTDRFFPGGRTSPAGVRACREAVQGLLGPVVRDLKRLDWDLAVGSGGTLRNLARMAQARRKEPRDLSRTGTPLTRREVDALTAELLALRDPARRSRLAGLDRDRADILPAGALALQGLMSALGIRRLAVSAYALREGLLLDTVEKRRGRLLQGVSEARRQSVEAFATRCGGDRPHGRRVARLALGLFDGAAPLHRLGVRERELLGTAALLHDVGLFVSRDQHHRHGYYLVRNAELVGFTDEEQEILANVARYHRKSHPKSGHDGYARLDAGARDVVRRLGGILRLADALDRTHRGAVRAAGIRPGKRRALLWARCRNLQAAAEERWACVQKKGLFEEAFGVRLGLSFRRGAAR